jgi:hypothetical protein
MNLILDRRQVEVGHKAPSLLGVLHVALLARDGIGALAALESEHDGSPWRASGRSRANSHEVLASQKNCSETLSLPFYLAMIENDAIPVKHATKVYYLSPF